MIKNRSNGEVGGGTRPKIKQTNKAIIHNVQHHVAVGQGDKKIRGLPLALYMLLSNASPNRVKVKVGIYQGIFYFIWQTTLK